MKFEVVDKVPFPLEEVYGTMRDKLIDLVPYLPDIKKIDCLERSETPDGVIKITNKWFAENRIPKAVQSLIKPEQLGWTDYAEWKASNHSVKYRLVMIFLSEYVDVRGENFFTGNERETQVRLTGELKLDLAKHPLIPRLLASVITGQVENLVLELIKPNLVKVNRGIEKHLGKR